MRKYTIVVVGLWHLGEVYSAALASLGHRVIGFDENEGVVNALSADEPPLAEPELRDMLRAGREAGRLSFTSDVNAVREAEVVWLAFDTPVADDDGADLTPIEDFIQKVIPFLSQNVLLVISSQVPVGTGESLRASVASSRPDLAFHLAYVPENLQLGRAVRSFLEPERVVIGAEDDEASQRVKDILRSLPADFLEMNLASAELTKHALNSFLATSLSFIYDIADVAAATGADVVDVTRALRADPRIGPGAYLDASIGFSGGTLARDLQALIRKGKDAGINLPVISAVFSKNKDRREIVISELRRHLGDLRGKEIAVLGLTYKPGTPTLRRALSVEIVRRLLQAGARVKAYDPMASREEIAQVMPAPVCSDAYEAATGCQAVLWVTNWPEFKEIDYHKLYQRLSPPHVFFDTRNFFHEELSRLKKIGFTYVGVGVGEEPEPPLT